MIKTSNVNYVSFVQIFLFDTDSRTGIAVFPLLDSLAVGENY